MKNTQLTAALILLVTINIFSQKNLKGTTSPAIRKIVDFETRSIPVIQFRCNVSNFVSGFMPDSDYQNKALYWPGGKNAYQDLLFQDQLLYAGYSTNHLKALVEGERGFFPGKILDNGVPDNPYKISNRIYWIFKGWETMKNGPERDSFEKDYNEWPVQDGAPWVDVDNDGVFTRGIDKPEIFGDHTLWYVYNDIGTGDSTYNYFNEVGFGLEIQVTVYAFDRPDDLADAIFRKYKIINKSGSNIQNFHLGFYTDFDVGDPNDDVVGTDTVLQMTYTYNYDEYDDVYPDVPPAVGTVLLQGPNKPGTANDSAYFNERWNKGYTNSKITDSYLQFNQSSPGFFEDPHSPQQILNILSGKMSDGFPITDPNTGNTVKFVCPGDPVNQSGWTMSNQGWPGLDTIMVHGPDIRSVMAMDSFNLAPYDTQEIVIATLAAAGEDRIGSVKELKRKANAVRYLFYNEFQNVKPILQPAYHSFTQQDSIHFWWDAEAESYKEPNPAIFGLGYEDTMYSFQGYFLEQYRDKSGRDPLIIKVLDKQDDISVIEDYLYVNGKKVKAPAIVGENKGIKHYFTLYKDSFTGDPLYNGNPYYFSVRAYAVNPNSIPSYIASKPVIREIIPGREKIDYTSPYKKWDEVYADKVNGQSDASIKAKIVDPTYVTGDEYNLIFYQKQSEFLYALTDHTTGDTLFKDESRMDFDTSSKKIFDGFMILIDDLGKKSVDSLPNNFRPYGIRKIIETRGPGGIPLDNPINVFNELNSTGKWMITEQNNAEQYIDAFNHIGIDDYEIRFTEGGSEYYTYRTGVNSLFGNNSKAGNRLPFELWDVTQERRLFIKTQDINVQDNKWSQDSLQRWERIMAYDPGQPYAEPISPFSEQSLAPEYPFGNVIIKGELPEPGTVIRIETYKPLEPGDIFSVTPEQANFNNTEHAKNEIDKISVFPNPYFGGSDLERSMGERIIRFTGLPKEVTIRIYTLAGVFVRRIYKSDLSQYIDWDLKNESGNLVASGVYIAHLDMMGIGTKILKIAVVIGKEFLNRE